MKGRSVASMVLWLVFITAAHAQSPVISTVAGGGAGDGTRALGASLAGLRAVAVDANGNLYVVDSSLGVRRVDAASGVITHFAGGGSSLGDGGPASGAGLSARNIAFDAQGNLHISDTLNSRIRKVDARTGIISTVAGNGVSGFSGDGGAATGASLSNPSGVAFDASGALYIADQSNNRIRRVAAGIGIITTVAGNGTSQASNGDGGKATSASVASPAAIACDSAGNLYIVENSGHHLRRVDSGTGIIDSVARNVEFSSPSGIAIDPTGDLYVADSWSNRIHKVEAESGAATEFAGSGPGLFSFSDDRVRFSGDGGSALGARLDTPSAVAVDRRGNLYIADTDNYRVRKVDASTGIIDTVAGGFNVGFAGDGGLATSAALFHPVGIAFDRSGDYYIADGNFHLRKVTASTGTITTVAGTGNPNTSGDGGPATDAGGDFTGGVALDGSGNVYFTGNGRVRKVTAGTGIITTVAGGGSSLGDGGPATNAGLRNPWGIAFDGSGNLYIAETENHRVRKVAATTGIITTVAGNGVSATSGDGGQATSASLSQPTGVALDASGNLYIMEWRGARVRRVQLATGIITTFAGGGSSRGDGGPAASAGLSSDIRAGIALDADGNLYISDDLGIRKVAAGNGVITTIAGGKGGFSGDGGPAVGAGLQWPAGLALDPQGNLHIVDFGNHRVRKVSAFPANYEGLWWKTPAGSESGWGVNLTHQGDILFATWFTYDADGSGLWLVMPNGARAGDGSYSGALYRTTGPAFSASPWNAAGVNATLVGSAYYSFGNGNNGAFSYTLNGVTQTKPLARQVFASTVPTCLAGGPPGASPNYQGLWWRSPAGSESGWGVNITHQGDTLFATWFTYDAAGKGQWLVMSNGTRTGPGRYAGALYKTTGPSFGATPWNPAQVVATQVGTATFAFDEANAGTFSYVVNGIAQSKPITRQIFATPASTCG